MDSYKFPKTRRANLIYIKSTRDKIRPCNLPALGRICHRREHGRTGRVIIVGHRHGHSSQDRARNIHIQRDGSERWCAGHTARRVPLLDECPGDGSPWVWLNLIWFEREKYTGLVTDMKLGTSKTRGLKWTPRGQAYVAHVCV